MTCPYRCAGTVNIPTFGNGDAMNFEDYNVMKEKSGVSGATGSRIFYYLNIKFII